MNFKKITIFLFIYIWFFSTFNVRKKWGEKYKINNFYNDFKICNSLTASLYTDKELKKIENNVDFWYQNLSLRLSLAVDMINLQNIQQGNTIWDELKELKDPGCTNDNSAFQRYGFQLWNPVAPCNNLEYIGNHQVSDGTRSICSFDASLKKRFPCIIYSLGSNGDFAFEDSIIQNTQHCMVYTFDCTMSGEYSQIFERIKGRHWFYPWCVSNVDNFPSSLYMTLNSIFEKLQHSYKHLTMLKMDIEAFEHEILHSWNFKDKFLPEQLFMEVHCTTAPISTRYRYKSIGELTVLLIHMTRLGYRLTSVQKEGGGIDASFVRLVCPD